MTRLLCSLALCLSLVAPSAAKPHKSQSGIRKRVDAHLRRGIELYAKKQFELAIVEFRAGYALDPRPDFLFALAQAERLSGDCPTAVVYYRRYLRTKPGANRAEAARVNMKRCLRALESGPGRTASDEPSKPAAPRAAAPSPIRVAPWVAQQRRVPSPGKRWYRDGLTLTFAGGAAAALAVGAGYWLASGGAIASAENASTDVEYTEQLAAARRDRSVSAAALITAGLLSAGATYRILSLRGTRNHERASIAATPTRGGMAVSLSGSF